MLLKNKILQTISEIKNNPLDCNLRLLLIQYYCISCQWDLALKSLQQYLKLNPNDLQTKALFLGNIQCEISRKNIFFDGKDITAYLKKDNKVLLQNEILKYLNSGENINSLFNKLHDETDQILLINLNDGITLDGDFVNTDIRLSHVFEIFEEDRYSWISIADIESIQFKKTEFLVDLIWRRLEIKLKSDQHIACFMPVRYPILYDDCMDENLLFAKATIWKDAGDFSIAQGQVTFSNADLDFSILDISHIGSIQKND